KLITDHKVALYAVALHDHDKIIRYFFGVVGLDHHDIARDEYCLFLCACTAPYARVREFLESKIMISLRLLLRRALYVRAFAHVCARSDLQRAQEMCRHYCFTQSEIWQDDHKVLVTTAASDNIPTTRWLLEMFYPDCE